MIKNKDDLRKYIKADEIMNDFSGWRFNIFKQNFWIRIFMWSMRNLDYYEDQKNLLSRIKYVIFKLLFVKASIKCGFSIGHRVFGYGLVIPHYGTIVTNGNSQVGNFCVLHTSTCIGGGKKTIGDNFYLSTGAQVQGRELLISDNVSVCANSIVNKDIPQNCLIGGMPNNIIKSNYTPWFERDGDDWCKKVEQCKILFDESH